MERGLRCGCTRELHEETGIPNVDMGPCVWVQQTEYDFAGYHFESDDRIHVAWCDGGEYDPKGLEALEAAAFMGPGGGLLTNSWPATCRPCRICCASTCRR